MIIGGFIVLSRNRRGEVARPRPADEPAAVIEPALMKAGSEYLSWEAELASKIDMLEEAFQQLSWKLETAEDAAGSNNSIRILSKREADRRELLPSVAELSRQGFHPSEIAKKLRLSDEQVTLLLNFSLENGIKGTMGA